METIGFTVYEVREGELLFFFSFDPVMPFHSGIDALSLKCCAKVYVGYVTIKTIGRRCHRRNTAEIFFSLIWNAIYYFTVGGDTHGRRRSSLSS